MADQSNKRPNPYLSDSSPSTKRVNVINTPNKETQPEEDTPSQLLGKKTGIHLPQPKPTKGSHTHHDRFEYGNYTNYYKSRRHNENNYDPRLILLDPALFTDKHVLDIGCNTGNITIAIGKQCRPHHIKGVDIDQSLIRKARDLLRTVYSLEKHDDDEDNTPSTSGVSPSSLAIDIKFQTHYFPQSMSYMYGFIPTLPPSYVSTAFPYNVSFDDGDWMKMKVDENSYDTILALSITKWIQLHGGDEGLKEFFKRIHTSLKKGGVLVLEPQHFGSYERRAKTSETMMQTLSSIQFKPEQYDDFLMNQVGFEKSIPLGIPRAETKGFLRPLCLYIK